MGDRQEGKYMLIDCGFFALLQLFDALTVVFSAVYL